MEPYGTFIAFDVETMGLDVTKHKIVEIAGVKFTFEKEGSKLISKTTQTFSSLVKPNCFIPKEATAIHGITNDMVEDAPAIDSVLRKFIRFCGLSSILVAHHAPFDIKFIKKALVDHKIPLIGSPVVDNLKITKKIMPESPSQKLGQLARILSSQMNLDVGSGALHRALYDCKVLKEIFSICLKKRFEDKDLQLDQISTSLEKIHGPFLKFSGL